MMQEVRSRRVVRQGEFKVEEALTDSGLTQSFPELSDEYSGEYFFPSFSVPVRRTASSVDQSQNAS